MSGQLDPHDILVAGLDALQVTQYARAREFTLPGDGELTAPPGRFGPLADELAAIDPRLAVGPPGDRRVSIDTVAGLAWAAAALAGDRAATLESRVSDIASDAVDQVGDQFTELESQINDLQNQLEVIQGILEDIQDQLS